MRILASIIAASAFLAIVWACVASIGALLWQQRTDKLVSTLMANQHERIQRKFRTEELQAVPAPVRRYLLKVLPAESPALRSVMLHHTGLFNMGEADDRWVSFKSSQWVVTESPGFVWNGQIAMLPGISVQVHDAYLNGEGILHPAIFGLFSLANMHGTGDIAAGELLRFLAESPWYPTILAPGAGIEWTAIDDRSAKATLVDGQVRAEMTFRFGPDDLIESVHADSRGRTVAGQLVPTPWEGRWWNYQRREGFLIPMSGEVSWLLPQGPKPYWRGTVDSVSFK